MNNEEEDLDYEIRNAQRWKQPLRHRSQSQSSTGGGRGAGRGRHESGRGESGPNRGGPRFQKPSGGVPLGPPGPGPQAQNFESGAPPSPPLLPVVGEHPTQTYSEWFSAHQAASGQAAGQIPSDGVRKAQYNRSEGLVSQALNSPDLVDLLSGDLEGDTLPQFGAFAAPLITGEEFFFLQEDDDNDGPAAGGFARLNDADRAEREGREPNDSFALPARRHQEFDYRFFGPGSNNILHIARKTGTHLSMLEDTEDPVIYMWGTPGAIAQAKTDLHSLADQVRLDIDQGQRRVAGWAKIRAAPTDRKQLYLEKLVREGKERRFYRLPPPANTVFPCIGIFAWPRDYSPHTLLGISLEGLDQVREEHKVYITYNRKRSLFRILGNNSSSVDEALDRIAGTLFEYVAKIHKGEKMFLVEPLHPDKVLSTFVEVREEHDLIDRQISIRKIADNKGIQITMHIDPANIVPPSQGWMKDWRDSYEVWGKANDQYLREVTRQALQKVQYFRGYARLKFYIGRLVLFGYKKHENKRYDFKEYSDMVRNPQTTGELIRSIGSGDFCIPDSQVAEELIQFCKNDKDNFHPVDINPDDDHRGVAGELEVQISATFEMRLFDEKGRSTEVRLEVSFDRVPNKNVYKAGQRRWLMVLKESMGSQHDGVSRRKCPVDVKVHDLHMDLAYQMELTTWPTFPYVDGYPIFERFLRHLKIEEIPDESDPVGEPAEGQADQRRKVKRISFTNLPGISVVSLVQKTKWRHWINKTHYVMEITKYERLPIDEVSMIFPDGVSVSYRYLSPPLDTRWGVALFNDQWDAKLRGNMHLETGRKGKWDPDIRTFFTPNSPYTIDGKPATWDPNDGFSEAIGRIKDVMGCVRAAHCAILRKRTLNAQARSGAYNGLEEFDV